MSQEKEWFEEWFDSPYYHILYGERDDREAEYFLDNLLGKFSPDRTSRIIDLACGKGRHSIYLNKQGFDVFGVDLSENSIQTARAEENDKLHFFVGDLRQLNCKDRFDIALNLFTSFGYFDSFETDIQVLKEIHGILNPDGYLLIDFMNASRICQDLLPYEEKEREGILFHITKEIQEGKIIKTIRFQHQEKDYCYQEKVQTLTLADFTALFEKSGFTLIQTFGGYCLKPYDESSSERLILIAKKV